MWCWLQWFWPQACYCCSAWHWSVVAGTSLSDAPRDQPDPVLYSSLWRPKGEEEYDICCTYSCCHVDCCTYCVCVRDSNTEWKREKDGKPCIAAITSELILNIYIFCHSCSGFDLTMFTLLGCRGRSRTRTQTWTLQGKILPRKTRLLLQLALQHKHTNTQTHALTHTHTSDINKGTQRWSKMSYCRNTDQIFIRWPTVRLNSNLRLAPQCAFQPLLAHKVRNSDPKDKA